MSATSSTAAPSVMRRVLCGVYDLLLLVSLLFIATALALIPYQTLTGHDFTSGLPRLLLQLYLLVISVGYYLYCWSGGRQTLGMRAWRIHLRQPNGQPLTRALASRRLLWTVVGLAPLALLWQLLTRQQYAWHDRASATYPVLASTTA